LTHPIIRGLRFALLAAATLSVPLAGIGPAIAQSAAGHPDWPGRGVADHEIEDRHVDQVQHRRRR